MSTPPLRSAGRGRGESPRRTPTKVSRVTTVLLHINLNTRFAITDII